MSHRPNSGVREEPAFSHEPRLIVENGVEARIAAIVEALFEELDFRLVQVRILSRNGCTLQIMAERADGTLTTDDCATISRALSPILDFEDPITGAYHLEVSSPGVDRPLVRRADFATWCGHEVKITLRAPVGEQKRYRGRIVRVADDGIDLTIVSRETFRGDDGQAEGPDKTKRASGADDVPVVRIRFDQIRRAQLVLTDALLGSPRRRQVG